MQEKGLGRACFCVFPSALLGPTVRSFVTAFFRILQQSIHCVPFVSHKQAPLDGHVDQTPKASAVSTPVKEFDWANLGRHSHRTAIMCPWAVTAHDARWLALNGMLRHGDCHEHGLKRYNIDSISAPQTESVVSHRGCTRLHTVSLLISAKRSVCLIIPIPPACNY